jgi:hypothetical protein
MTYERLDNFWVDGFGTHLSQKTLPKRVRGKTTAKNYYNSPSFLKLSTILKNIIDKITG